MAEGKYKNYLEFLDKEMTVMGILSAFCIGVVSLALDRILSAKQVDDSYFFRVSVAGWLYVILGSVAIVIAAVCFYLQRSDLAGNYGEFCYYEATKRKDIAYKCLEDTYPRAFWKPYYLGFGALVIGFLEYVLALTSPCTDLLRRHPTWIGLLAIIIGVAIFALWIRIQLSEKNKSVPHPVRKMLTNWFSWRST
jgi:hypothetical protein